MLIGKSLLVLPALINYMIKFSGNLNKYDIRVQQYKYQARHSCDHLPTVVILVTKTFMVGIGTNDTIIYNCIFCTGYKEVYALPKYLATFFLQKKVL